jgi:isoleucyl-tRNA synthetase
MSHSYFLKGHLLQMVLPGIHHVMARAIKDILDTKLKKRVPSEACAGWDTHGLPRIRY